MPEPLPPPVWVNTKELLQQTLDDLAAQSRLAVDTESNSLHAFREQVCLLQISSASADYLIDPLALQDLSALAPIFSNPKIEKIFHAAEYDLICLRRDFGFSFANLFDTMHAARVLGYPAVGLDTLLRDKLQIQTDKRHQKANWAKRPLTTEQIHYARLDTHYLFDLRDTLEKELREKERLEFAKEDFNRACFFDEQKMKSNGASWERFANRKDLSNRDLTILAALCQWRDAEAEKLNRPVYKVMMDETLVALSKNPPEHKVDLSALGMSERQIQLWGDSVLEAVRQGKNAPLVKRKLAESPSDAYLRRMEKLKLWRKKVGIEMGVESDVILPKAYISAIAQNPPKSLDDLALLMKETPSRVEKYGLQILKVLGVKNAN
ncbi:MAG: HRDC domain-containing protein [Chloroflexi bacterium]|nr:HRDC domain-containing protein [Chloroflexota bacterium]